MDPKMLAPDAAEFLGITIQAIHKKLKSKGLAFKKTQNRVYFRHKTARELFKLDFKRKIIAIQIVKGGTGKTSLTHSIAIRANLYGARVLCIDLDQQGNLTQAFHTTSEKNPIMIDVLNNGFSFQSGIINITDGLDLFSSRIENAILDSSIMIAGLPIDRVYKERIEEVQERYDLILIDCPPALGHSVAAATLSADFVIAPVTPEKFSLSALKVTAQEIENIEKKYHKAIQLKILVNKYDSRTTLSHETLSSLIKHPIFGQKVLKTYVRINQEFPNSIFKGISIFDYTRNNTAKEDIDQLTRELLEIKAIERQDMCESFLGSLDEKRELMVPA